LKKVRGALDISSKGVLKNNANKQRRMKKKKKKKKEKEREKPYKYMGLIMIRMYH